MLWKDFNPSMQHYYKLDTHSAIERKQLLLVLIRAIVLAALAVLLVSLAVALLCGWYMGLLFVLGGLLFACCCFISYYSRISFSFNNIADTNQSSVLAFFTNSIPRHHLRPSLPEETFQPFKFAATSQQAGIDTEQQVLEDARVRAILRQVFPDEGI